jgi:hypothetical protein
MDHELTQRRRRIAVVATTLVMITGGVLLLGTPNSIVGATGDSTCPSSSVKGTRTGGSTGTECPAPCPEPKQASSYRTGADTCVPNPCPTPKRSAAQRTGGGDDCSTTTTTTKPAGSTTTTTTKPTGSTTTTTTNPGTTTTTTTNPGTTTTTVRPPVTPPPTPRPGEPRVAGLAVCVDNVGTINLTLSNVSGELAVVFSVTHPSTNAVTISTVTAGSNAVVALAGLVPGTVTVKITANGSDMSRVFVVPQCAATQPPPATPEPPAPETPATPNPPVQPDLPRTGQNDAEILTALGAAATCAMGFGLFRAGRRQRSRLA